MYQIFLIAFLALFSPGLDAGQQQPEIKMSLVAGALYMIEGGGGNIGVMADPAGLFMVDAMEQPSAERIRAAVKSLPGGQRVRILVNTHWHSDHTDGNKVFGPGAAVIAHENVRALLARDQPLLGRVTKALPAEALPGVTYSDSLTVYAGGGAIRLVHYPNAHTDGDTVVFFDDLKAVHMGDMFFNGMFPFLDVTNGGDIDGWGRQLDLILAGLPDEVKIIPGHGPLARKSDLVDFRRMLGDSADLVRTRISEGKTLDEIKAAGLPERFNRWSQGFFTTSQWLELVHASLTKSGNPARAGRWTPTWRPKVAEAYGFLPEQYFAVYSAAEK